MTAIWVKKYTQISFRIGNWIGRPLFASVSFGRICPTATQDDGRFADIPRAKGCVRHQRVLFPLYNMPAALGNRFLEIYRGNTVNTGEKGSKF